MKGWRGRILTVDLGSGKTPVITPSARDYAERIGGRGLAGSLLFPEVTRHWRDPELPLIFMTGPLVDTLSPTPGRMTIMSRSPLTGTICDASVGGGFGVQLKRAGWDGILVTGRSPRLCAIEIHNNEVQIQAVEDAAGLSPNQIRSRTGGGGSIAAVGRAAENGVRFAGIIVDEHYFAGRGGLGYLMASRNLKYIRVLGETATPVHDFGELKAARRDILRLSAASPILQGELGLHIFGTAALYDLVHQRRMMPTANFRLTRFPGAEQLNAPALHKRYRPKSSGCAGCHIRCKKSDSQGRSLPEFETLSHFTALLENHDLEAVMAANQICGEAGMDTIEAGATLACHFEILGRSPEPDEILNLLQAMANGTRPDLAGGARRLAAAAGRPETAMTVKGQSLPAYDPRGAYGMALAYAVSTRGGCHLRAYPISHEILRKPVATDRFSFTGKARMVKIAEDQNAVVDSLTACKFMFFAVSLEEYSRALTAVTGLESSAHELQSAGERIVNQEREMNRANGFSDDDDDLPARFFKEPGSSGNGIIVPPLDRTAFLAARAIYYRIRENRPLGKMDENTA
ncbi:MAG: aldehyde ferredoxin oxidoreductase [Candidatus Aminicenantes bacterium]|nr:aldehyde ferredoxin oxidoreductase [Candidatus Aminicenantes bacterium]